MADDHVCITGNLRTAHGDLGAPISERTPVVQWGRVCRIKQKARFVPFLLMFLGKCVFLSNRWSD
jgi:hypothetical protein